MSHSNHAATCESGWSALPSAPPIQRPNSGGDAGPLAKGESGPAVLSRAHWCWCQDRSGWHHPPGTWYHKPGLLALWHLCLCLRQFGKGTSQLALDCLVQVRLRCLRKQHKEMGDAGMGAAIKECMASHHAIEPVQRLGKEVLGLLMGSATRPLARSRLNGGGSSMFERYAQAQEAVPSELTAMAC